MEIFLLLLLMITAGAFFLPGILKERALDSPIDTISDFRRGMTALAISTHNHDNLYFSHGQEETESYFRRREYRGEFEDDYYEDVIPYPRNKARAEMEVRRHRITAGLLIVVLASGIASLIPGLDWVLPFHIAMLVLLAGYIFLVILLPGYNRRR